MANLEQRVLHTNKRSCTESDLIPSGFHLEHETVSNETWEAIQHWLFSNMLPSSSANNESTKLVHVPIPWESGEQMQGRKVAQFGSCKYDYTADEAVLCEQIIPIPTYIREALLSNEDSEHYTQCIINVYEARNEIPWHLDHEYFGDKVLVYTFGEERPLLLRKPICHKDNKCIAYGSIGLQEPEEEYTFHITRAYPRHCSKYILKGVARNEWEHSVPRGNDKRVSITFRSWRGAK
jgi:alkylated DNA repair dioxygenase AlkB